MEITSFLEIMKAMKFAPEGFSLIIVLVFILSSIFLKKKDIDLTQVTSISKLQSEQLTTLIEQNTHLAKELHAVRQELTEAYRMIDDMRNRVTELEEMLKDTQYSSNLRK